MAKTAGQTKWLAALVAVVMVGAAQAAPVAGQGTWETTLKGRDIDGNPVDQLSERAVFLYDTELDITWLRDANLNGPMHWNIARSWAHDLVVGAYNDWRLPTALNPDGSGPCDDFNCTGSEMGHLHYVTLGNKDFSEPLFNTGSFQNLQFKTYWSEEMDGPEYAWFFDMHNGAQHQGAKGYFSWYALAVRPGDVVAVPEPQTYVMLLAGLGFLGFVVRRRKETAV